MIVSELPNFANSMPRAERIAQLNDRLRKTGIVGQIVMTSGVNALIEEDAAALLEALGAYDSFDEDNDPHGERDFGETYQPEAWSLRGVHMIEPVSQGDYDGLCGLYCIINALRLVLAPHEPLRDEDVQALFRAGVRFLASQGKLPQAVQNCVGERMWPRLAEALRARAQQLSSLVIRLERPRLPQDLSQADITLSMIERIITSGKAPMVFMRGKYRHYTVISGYTPASLKLFDSFGYHWVRRSSCGTSKGQKLTLHRFHVQSLLAVSVEPPAPSSHTFYLGRK